MLSETVILANGSYPEHEIPLEIIRNAKRIICCDGSAVRLVKEGLEPLAIVGDLDSLGEGIAERFSDRLFRDDDQETNDLTKALFWCSRHGYKDIIITGGTGKREDHTIGNISLLAEYAREVNVTMVTDTGVFKPFLESCSVESFPGQQVSIFSIDPETEITSSGLKYRLDRIKLHNWWRATLNEATGHSFELRFTGGPVIVYLKFRE